jgi:hypothetical protein
MNSQMHHTAKGRHQRPPSRRAQSFPQLTSTSSATSKLPWRPSGFQERSSAARVGSLAVRTACLSDRTPASWIWLPLSPSRESRQRYLPEFCLNGAVRTWLLWASKFAFTQQGVLTSSNLLTCLAPLSPKLWFGNSSTSTDNAHPSIPWTRTFTSCAAPVVRKLHVSHSSVYDLEITARGERRRRLIPACGIR